MTDTIYGWQLLIDGPMKHHWIPMLFEHKGYPPEIVEVETEQSTIARYIRAPLNDFPGTFCYRFDGELDHI